MVADTPGIPAVVPRKDTLPARADSPIARLGFTAAEFNALDATKLGALLDMKNREEDRAAKQAFIAAKVAVQKAVQPVVKRHQNEKTGSMYANLEDVSAALDPILEAEGFAVSFSEGEGAPEGEMRHVMLLQHVGGHEEIHHKDLPPDGIGPKGNPIGGMNRLQGRGSSDSYGQRYLKAHVFNLRIVEDIDGNTPQNLDLINEDQRATIETMMDEIGTRERLSKQLAALYSWPDMLAVNFKAAVSLLEARRRAA